MATRITILHINKVALVPKGANQAAHVLLYKAALKVSSTPKARKDMMGSDDDEDEGPPMTLEERQASRALWQQWNPLWWDFCDTVHEVMDGDEDDAGYADILMASIEQFRSQAGALLGGLGLLSKAAPSLAVLDEVHKAGAVMAAGRKSRLQAAIATLQVILDEAAPKEPPTTKALKGAEMAETLEGVTKRAETAEARIKVLEADLLKAKQTPEEQEAAYLAELPAAVKKQYEADKLEKAALREELRVEKDARQRQEYIEKTASYRAVGITPDHWNVLKAIDAMPEQERTELTRILASATEVIKQGNVLATVGKDGTSTAGDGTEAKVHALVKAEQEKDGKLSYSDALQKVWAAHQDLYSAYYNEKRQAGRA